MGSILVAEATGRISKFKAKLNRNKDTFIKAIHKGIFLNIHENRYLSLIKVRRDLLLVDKLFDRNDKSTFLYFIVLSRDFFVLVRATSGSVKLVITLSIYR
jgi:hypothetical protein